MIVGATDAVMAHLNAFIGGIPGTQSTPEASSDTPLARDSVDADAAVVDADADSSGTDGKANGGDAGPNDVGEAPGAAAADRGGGADIGTAIIADGPTHTGSGPQVNFGQDNDYTFYLGLHNLGRLRISDVTPTWLASRHLRFIAPGHYDRTVDLLGRQDGLAILHGAAGSGRRTAALMLLYGENAETNVRVIPPEFERRVAQAEWRTFEASDVLPGNRLLLDLSDVEEESFIELQSYLHTLQTALFDRNAKLVVVLPSNHNGLRDFRSYLVEIRRPDATQVLAKHLAAKDIDGATNLVRYRDRLASMSMAAVEQPASRAADEQRLDPTGSVHLWLERAINSEVERRQTVSSMLNTLKAGRPRSLLLSAALLDGAPRDTVFLGQHRLLEILRTGDTEPENDIELAGVTRALSELNVDLQMTLTGRLTFADEALAQMVMQHFWDELPWLRPKLIEWVRHLVGSTDLDLTEQLTVARRIGDQCRQSRRADLALSLVEDWANRNLQTPQSAAYQLLCDLLDDDRTAPPARQLLYWWARDENLSRRRAAIVIAACVEVLGQVYPDQAVVRLSWLT